MTKISRNQLETNSSEFDDSLLGCPPGFVNNNLSPLHTTKPKTNYCQASSSTSSSSSTSKISSKNSNPKLSQTHNSTKHITQKPQHHHVPSLNPPSPASPASGTNSQLDSQLESISLNSSSNKNLSAQSHSIQSQSSSISNLNSSLLNRQKVTLQDLETHAVFVRIIDATSIGSEAENSYFVVETLSNYKQIYPKNQYSVKRNHLDFVWLYEKFQANMDREYLGYLLPSKPSKPDFSSSLSQSEKYNFAHEQLTRYEQANSTTNPNNSNFITRKSTISSVNTGISNFSDRSEADKPNKLLEKLKKNCETEYLASFKKCVKDHENFLIKLSEHPVLKTDKYLMEFLTSEDSRFEIFKMQNGGASSEIQVVNWFWEDMKSSVKKAQKRGVKRA